MIRVLVLCIVLLLTPPEPNINLSNTPYTKTESTESPLLDAIIHVERGGDPTKHAKGEDAVGCLQIRKIMIRDVNRILKKQKKKKRYKYKDRWDCKKSKEVFDIVVQYYLPGACDEDIARLWNGGPTGPIKKDTKKYWKKVLKTLKRNKNERANS